jgi:GxxExxY protein
MELLHKELGYKIVGFCLDIYNNYGPHHKEVVYQRLLKEKFDLANLKSLWEPKIDIYSQDTNKIIGCYAPDLLVDDKIIIEVKAAMINCFRDEEQIFHYLKVGE